MTSLTAQEIKVKTWRSYLMYHFISQPHPIIHEILTNFSVDYTPSLFLLHCCTLIRLFIVFHLVYFNLICVVDLFGLFLLQSVLQTAFKNHVSKQECDHVILYSQSSLTPFQVWIEAQIPSPTFEYWFGPCIFPVLFSIILHFPEPRIFAISLYSLPPNRLLLFSFWSISSYFLCLQCFSVTLLQFIYWRTNSNQLPQKAFRISQLGLNHFFHGCSMSPWHFELKFTWIYSRSTSCFYHLPHPWCVLRKTMSLTMWSRTLLMLILLCQSTFTCPYHTHSHLKQ